jgi:TrmH family RNA methyltransferase
MPVLRSRDNPRVRRWRELVADPRARRRERSAVIEGVHLLSSYLASGGRPRTVIASASAMDKLEMKALLGERPVIVANSVFRLIADTESPAGIAAEIPLPEGRPSMSGAACAALLEGIQDAGNVGAILRSAAAFGVRDVVLGPGCADAWSPKALRAGMGAHFMLELGISKDPEREIGAFGGTTVCTVPQGGVPLARADLTGRTLWLFGAEGRGVSQALARRATLKVTIPMPGAAESLNVAAAAAICFYELSRRGARS